MTDRLRRRGLAAILAVMGWPAIDALGAALPIQLQPAVALQAGGAALDVGTHAIPCVTDWNGDGRKDLLVGYRTSDKVAVFLNVGTDAEPLFQNSANLQAGGVDIQWPSAGCGAPAPWVCDYDHDGQRDLLVGTGIEGNVWFYRNLGTDALPVLAAGVQLRVGPGALTVPARATPYVHDWDEDGREDLLCGAGDGQVYLFRNTGTAAAPAYAAAVALLAGGRPVDLGDRSVVRVFDWDGDGLKDLVGSASYNASWCRNTHRNDAPIFEAPIALKAPTAGAGLAAINTGYRMRLELVDWDGDGVMDVLIGKDDGQVSLYAGYQFAVVSVTCSPSDALVLTWASAPFLTYEVLGGGLPEALTTPLVTRLPSSGLTTSWTNPVPASPTFFRVRVGP